jgi:spore coat polysaccharide biosynthesis predicted glycosyltransferase SpsG
MKKLMLDSDIAITAGGQTLYELARTGTPAIGICVAENQRRNLDAWHRADVIEYIGWFDDKSLSSKLLKGLDKLSGRAERAKRSRLGRQFVDGKGVERIVAGITWEKGYANKAKT